MYGVVTPGNPDFIGLMDETEQMLQKLFPANNWVVFFPGSGRVSIDSALLGLLGPGEKILVPVNGVFSKWIGVTAERLGAKPVRLELDWRKAVDPGAIKRALDKDANIKVVAAVHNETATGIVNSIETISKDVHDYGALFLVDYVSFLGEDEVNTDGWGFDLDCRRRSYKFVR